MDLDFNKEINMRKEFEATETKDGLRNGKGKVDFKQVRAKAKKAFRQRPGKFKGTRQVGKEFNDVSWYTKNKTITEAFAKLPFNYIVGNTIPSLKSGWRHPIPAIVSYNVDWAASVASSRKLSAISDINSITNVIDLVAMIIYGNMRRNNSGSTNNIEYLDVLVSNLVASIDIYANVHYIHRIFRTANTYSWKNRTIPKYIFSDHWGIDYEDFIRNQALYRGRFDTLVAKAQTIRTLANFPFIDAIKAQFTDIFKDTDTDTGREEIIVSAKPFHHIYDPEGSSANPGGMVRLVQVKDVPEWDSVYTASKTAVVYTGTPRNATERSNPIKMQHLLSILDAQINALITDSDFNLIQADLEKAFGDSSGYIVVDPVTEVSPISPVYSGEFMTMFHNGLFYDLPNTGEELNSNGLKTYKANAYINIVYQEHAGDGRTSLRTDIGWWSNTTTSDTNGKEGYDAANRFIDIDVDDPSVEDVVIMTRFRSAMKSGYGADTDTWKATYPTTVDATKTDLLIVVAGSNFITWGGNITVIQTSGLTVTNDVFFKWNNTKAYNLSQLGSFIDRNRQALYTIEKCPMLPLTDNQGMFGEINNIRLLPESEMLPIHEACFLSLWNLPERTNI